MEIGTGNGESLKRGIFKSENLYAPINVMPAGGEAGHRVGI